MSVDAKTTAAAPKKAKLYYTATSCGAASFITAVTNGLKIDTELVELSTHKTASGADFYAINPKGNVPALVLADGTVLNENVAVLQYLADQNLSVGRVSFVAVCWCCVYVCACGCFCVPCPCALCVACLPVALCCFCGAHCMRTVLSF